MTPVWYLLLCFGGASLESHHIAADYVFRDVQACANMHKTLTMSHGIAPDRCICQPISPVVPMDPLGHEPEAQE
jgi:hypothetical protein